MIFFKGRKASEELTLPSYYLVLDLFFFYLDYIKKLNLKDKKWYALFFKPITAIIIYENLSLLPWAQHQS